MSNRRHRPDDGHAARRRPTGPTDVGAFEGPLWRALAVFRLATLGYAGTLVVWTSDRYAHPGLAWPVLAVMVLWTATAVYGYAGPQRRGWPLLVADLLVVVGCLLVSRSIVGTRQFELGLATIPVTWHAGAVLAWAVHGGRRLGVAAAVLVAGCDIAVRAQVRFSTLTGAVLLVLAAATVGHVARLAVQAQQRLQRAVELEAATRERDRLARGIHDSVLQVLALLQRRGTELGGEAAELGRLAGEQEAALRALVSARPEPSDGGSADLGAALARHAGPDVTLAVPAGPVPLPTAATRAVTAAVGAALDNVRRHAGPQARAWILLESEPDAITVTVRDDGCGMPAGRPAIAVAEGRLGLAQSIRGRMADLGGTATITSAPGQGTEIELRLPRSTPPTSAT